jgi:hypothetical protein
MSLGGLLLFLHITVIFAAITVSFGPAIVLLLAVRTGQVATVRGVALAMRPLGRFIPILFVTGGLFGLLTGINLAYNLLAPWLVIAYVLFAIAMIQGATLSSRFAARLEAAIATARDGPLTPAIAGIFAEPRFKALVGVDYVVTLALVLDMVVKPFS